MTNDVVMIVCPPLSDYPEAPKDQSHCELFDCPKCKDKMWLSQKKKGILRLAAFVDKDVLLTCYHCFTKMVKEDPSLLLDSTMQDI